MPDNCRYCGLPMHAEGSCLENVNKMPDKDLKDLCKATQDGRLKKQMPDRVRECLINLLGITIDNEHRVELLEHKKDDIAQAKSALLKVVCEEIRKSLKGYDTESEEVKLVIEAMEILFGKEIA